MAWTCPCGASNGDDRQSCGACGRPLFQHQGSPQPQYSQLPPNYPHQPNWNQLPSQRPIFAGVMKVIAVISIVLGLISAGLTPESRVPFLVKVIIGSIIVFFGLLIVLAYFIPSYRAYQNRKRLAGIICVLNVFFGWTLIGWWLLWAWGNMPEKEDWQVLRMR